MFQVILTSEHREKAIWTWHPPHFLEINYTVDIQLMIAGCRKEQLVLTIRRWKGNDRVRWIKKVSSDYYFWAMRKSSFNMTSSTRCNSVSKFWQTIQRRSCVCVIYTLRIKQDRVDLKFKLAKYKRSKKWRYRLVSYILLLSISTHTYHTIWTKRSL